MAVRNVRKEGDEILKKKSKNVEVIDDKIKELIVKNASSMEIKNEALKQEYKPLIMDGISKVLNGVTTLQEINNKLVLY